MTKDMKTEKHYCEKCKRNVLPKEVWNFCQIFEVCPQHEDIIFSERPDGSVSIDQWLIANGL